MNDLLTWLGQYSLPVVILIALVGIILYVIKMATERTIALKFEQYSKSVGLQLQRRSNFEERVLLERYTLLRELHGKLSQVFTDILRHRSGTVVEGLMRGADVAPLTEIMNIIASNRYLLTDQFVRILDKQAQLALQLAQAPDQLTVDAGPAGLTALREAFDQEMNKHFALNRIGGAA